MRLQVVEQRVSALESGSDGKTLRSCSQDVESQIRELSKYHDKLWKREKAEVFPDGDNLTRMKKALHIFGLIDCKRAIAGHYKLSSRDGWPGGRELRHVFPAVCANGKPVSQDLDCGHVREYMALVPVQKERTESVNIPRQEPAQPVDREKGKQAAIACIARFKAEIAKGIK